MGYISLRTQSRKDALEESSAANSPVADELELGHRLETAQLGAASSSQLESDEKGAGLREDHEEHRAARSVFENYVSETGLGSDSGEFTDAEKGDTKVLIGLDGIEDGKSSVQKRKCFVQRHRCAVCCVGGCCLVSIFVVGLLCLIAYLLYRPKQPGVGLTDIKVNEFTPKITIIPPRATLSFNVSGLLSLDNPNYFAVSYQNTSAYVLYRNSSLATIPVDKGHVPARSRRDLSLSAVGKDFSVVSQIQALTSDLKNQRVPLTMNTVLPGKWEVLGFIKGSFEARIACNFTINPDAPSFRNLTLAEEKCSVKVTL